MNINKPLIGITPYYRPPSESRDFAPKQELNYVDLNYVRAVEQAGGVPLLLPHISDNQAIRQMAEMIDGLLLSGG